MFQCITNNTLIMTDPASKYKTAGIQTSCQVCSKATENHCRACKLVYYCSRAHQEEHWLEHKTFCKARRAAVPLDPRGTAVPLDPQLEAKRKTETKQESKAAKVKTPEHSGGRGGTQSPSDETKNFDALQRLHGELNRDKNPDKYAVLQERNKKEYKDKHEKWALEQLLEGFRESKRMQEQEDKRKQQEGDKFRPSLIHPDDWAIGFTKEGRMMAGFRHAPGIAAEIPKGKTVGTNRAVQLTTAYTTKFNREISAILAISQSKIRADAKSWVLIRIRRAQGIQGYDIKTRADLDGEQKLIGEMAPDFVGFVDKAPRDKCIPVFFAHEEPAESCGSLISPPWVPTEQAIVNAFLPSVKA